MLGGLFLDVRDQGTDMNIAVHFYVRKRNE